MSLANELATLAQAHGPQELAAAFRALQRGVSSARRAAKQKWGPLAQTFKVAMQIWDDQKAQGVPEADRVAGLEKTLRASWPQTREWKYVCQACRDTGLEMLRCFGDTSCGRQKRHLEHDYGQPCWCSAGAKFKAKPKPTAEDFTAAGKMSKPARIGR